MKLKPYPLEDLKRMREVVGPRRFKDRELVRVLDHVVGGGGDWEIALTALLMKPRPRWLKNLLFELQQTS